MKPPKQNRGQIRIIEAFFASVLILSSVALIPSQTSVTNSSDQFPYSIERNVLATLDSDGSLATLIESQNWTALRTCITLALPPSVWFNTTIFDENMQPVNQAQICSGSPMNGRIAATDYFCASQSGDYRIYIIRMQLSTVS